jgi:hypothetical protein
MKFISDLRQVGGFLRVLRFPPPTARHEITEILLKMALNIYIKLLNETKSNGVMDLFSKVMKRLYLYYIILNDHSIELLYFYYHESASVYFFTSTVHCFGRFFRKVIRTNLLDLRTIGTSTVGLSDYWVFGLLGIWTIGPSDYWAFRLLGLRTIGPSDYWAFDLLDHRTIGPSDYWTFGLSGRHQIIDTMLTEHIPSE